jgi:hypothetical protein
VDTVSLNYYAMYKNTFLNKNLLTIEFTGMFVVGQLFCVVIKYKKEQYLLACMHAWTPGNLSPATLEVILLFSHIRVIYSSYFRGLYNNVYTPTNRSCKAK